MVHSNRSLDHVAHLGWMRIITLSLGFYLSLDLHEYWISQGCSMTKHLNIVMRNSWFDFTFRTPFIAALLYSIGWCLTILRIPWKSHPGLYAVMVIFLTLPGCQFALCFALDEILILSLLKGWSKQNPEVVSKPDCPIGVEDVVSQSDLDRVVRWIEHYKSIEVG